MDRVAAFFSVIRNGVLFLDRLRTDKAGGAGALGPLRGDDILGCERRPPIFASFVFEDIPCSTRICYDRGLNRYPRGV